MPSLRLLSSLVVSALALAACGSPNPNYCEGSSCDATDSPNTTCSTSGADPTCPPDNPICTNGVCGGTCTADTQCSARTDGATVCLVATGDCVQCDEPGTQATPGSPEDECTNPAMAVCDASSHTCRACRTGSECASQVCDNGTCAAPTSVLYMNNIAGTMDVGNCDTAATPCLTLTYALGKVTATRTYILMAPSGTAYAANSNGNNADINNKNVHIFGSGATLHRGDANGVILNVQGTSNVVIEGLIIEGTQGAQGTAITNAATLELDHATVRGNSQNGISSSSGELRVIGSTISGNLATGLVSNGGTVRVIGSTVSMNQAGGLSLSTTAYIVVNNFIVDNGGSSSTFGGVFISTTSTGNSLEFNTIAFNHSGVSTPDGVTCTNASLVARNNIIIGEATKPRINSGSICTFQSSLYGPDGTIPGAGNMAVANLTTFMFTTATNYHVLPGTIATGKAVASNLTADTLKDVDGDARQQDGTMVEVGADEIP